MILEIKTNFKKSFDRPRDAQGGKQIVFQHEVFGKLYHAQSKCHPKSIVAISQKRDFILNK